MSERTAVDTSPDLDLRKIREEVDRLVGPQAMYELLGPVLMILEMRRAELNDIILRVVTAAEVERRKRETQL